MKRPKLISNNFCNLKWVIYFIIQFSRLCTRSETFIEYAISLCHPQILVQLHLSFYLNKKHNSMEHTPGPAVWDNSTNDYSGRCQGHWPPCVQSAHASLLATKQANRCFYSLAFLSVRWLNRLSRASKLFIFLPTLICPNNFVGFFQRCLTYVTCGSQPGRFSVFLLQRLLHSLTRSFLAAHVLAQQPLWPRPPPPRHPSLYIWGSDPSHMFFWSILSIIRMNKLRVLLPPLWYLIVEYLFPRNSRHKQTLAVFMGGVFHSNLMWLFLALCWMSARNHFPASDCNCV